MHSEVCVHGEMVAVERNGYDEPSSNPGKVVSVLHSVTILRKGLHPTILLSVMSNSRAGWAL